MGAEERKFFMNAESGREKRCLLLERGRKFMCLKSTWALCADGAG